MVDIKRNIDIVLCIDGSSSIGNFIHYFQNNLSIFYSFLKNKYENKGVIVSHVRIKLICFRNFGLDREKSLFYTKFYNLPKEQSEIDKKILSIIPQGGSPNGNSGLEALAMAISSEWHSNSPKSRQIIILFSDTIPQELGEVNLDKPQYPLPKLKNFEELTDWWEDKDLDKIGQRSKKLILFAPDRGYWAEIGYNWTNAIHFTDVKYPFELDYVNNILDFITSAIVNSI